MHPITRTTICALAAATMAAPASAASADYYLKLDTPKGEAAARAGGGKQIEIMSWQFGVTRKGWDGTIKGSHSAEKYGAVGGMHRDDSLASPRDAASGMPTGKRQHGWVTISKPLDRGSVTVNGAYPDCVVGAQYDGGTLGGGASLFEFKDVQITSCAADGISFNYAGYRESPTRPSQK